MDGKTEMQAARWTLKARGFALASAVVLSAVSFPAYAQEGVDNLPDAALFRELIIGLGLRPTDRAAIDYRERSPLVVPPAMTLPPPDTRTVAERNPNWPLDQDIRRAREAAKRGGPVDQPNVLSTAELTPGTPNRPTPGSVSGPYHPTQAGTNPVSPSALGYVGGLFGSLLGLEKEESKAFTGEPPRTALIEPPAGYQTPSPKYSYGTGKPEIETKLYDPLSMGFSR
jgi:hypothetical protein